MYNRIGSFVPGITLILTAEYTTDMNEDSAMLFYNYTSTHWSLDQYILVHWLAPGVRLGLVSLPRIPTLLATDTQALLVDQVVQTKQRPSLACDPTS